MEYCPGGELSDVIASRVKHNKWFTELEVAAMMYTLLSALNHCHHQKVIHRDLKPENVMLGENGELKIIDFGLSLTPKSTPDHVVVGSAHYLAHDVICGKYNSKCDVWSLGVIMYILLSGFLPFSAENPK